MIKYIFFLIPAVIINAQIINLMDGQIFDEGFELIHESPSANPQLKELRYLPGQWDVDINTTIDDTTVVSSKGYSRISYMNRGHSLFERFSAKDFNGRGDELNTIFFLAFNNSNNQWNLGIADSYKENISLFNGTNTGHNLLLKNSVRRNGGILIHNYLMEIKHTDNNSFSITISEASDFLPAWETLLERVYSRREENTDYMNNDSFFGQPAADRPSKAVQFDFLIGEWTAHQ